MARIFFPISRLLYHKIALWVAATEQLHLNVRTREMQLPYLGLALQRTCLQAFCSQQFDQGIVNVLCSLGVILRIVADEDF